MGRGPDGKVCFVPRTAPGDEVEVAIEESAKDFSRGRLVKVLSPGQARLEPACEHFTRDHCGGCQWQHVSLEAQRAAKANAVARAVRRLPVVPDDIVAPVPPLGWRRRVRLSWGGGHAGLFAWKSRRIVDLSRCPQLEPALEARGDVSSWRATPTKRQRPG